LKPGNILIGDGNTAQISDFGLAIPANADFSDNSLAQYNYLLHRDPRTIEGADHDIQSDVYAAGVTFYRLVNGDTYLGNIDAIDDLDAEIVSGKFPNRTHYRSFVPRSLRTVINRALNVNAEKRYATATDFRRALEATPVCMSWKERVRADRVEWSGTAKGRFVRVTLRGGVVEVKKGPSRDKLRRISALCIEDTPIKAKQHARRVLQDFVTGQHDP
jgi:serine/threonine protein kinase